MYQLPIPFLSFPDPLLWRTRRHSRRNGKERKRNHRAPYQWLCLLGVPAVIAGIFKYLHTLIKHNSEDSKALKAGVQALLRSQMISDYNKWSERGYAPIYARENFENCWKQYHSLGVNGVMDDLHEKFLELPTAPVNEG